MKTEKNSLVKSTDTAGVDAYLKNVQHPLLDVAKALRKIILKTDKSIGEEIKWNAPAFFYTGEMKPFDPKQYKRHIVVFNLAKKDSLRLVFPSGAKIEDHSGLLEGDYTDGRRLATFSSLEDVKAKEKDLQVTIKKWLALVEK